MAFSSASSTTSSEKMTNGPLSSSNGLRHHAVARGSTRSAHNRRTGKGKNTSDADEGIPTELWVCLGICAVLCLFTLAGLVFATRKSAQDELLLQQIQFADWSSSRLGWTGGKIDPNSPSPAERNRYSSDTLHEFFSSSSAEQAAPEKSTQTIAFQKTAQRDRTLSEVAYRLATGTSHQAGAVPMLGSADQLVTQEASTDAPEEEEDRPIPRPNSTTDLKTSEDTIVEVTIDRLGNILLPGVVKLPYRAEIAAQYSSYMNSDPGQPTSRRLDRWSGFGSPFDAVYGPYADEKFWQIGLRVIRKASSTSAALSNEVSIW
eukprot:CAMPEP_0178986994 /NCGR_PEP_ID=MMETSP0795-20121207/3009_1 /TAXON_ID=88552 /ORGANISM="Amoebophrya sp., Strain Ameob2" /LENGTH=317 /DNA_ID=CAMNT_0020678109 /DNA_START=212 /DNA_END=1162 /DNA_ORIENTATION=+